MIKKLLFPALCFAAQLLHGQSDLSGIVTNYNLDMDECKVSRIDIRYHLYNQIGQTGVHLDVSWQTTGTDPDCLAGKTVYYFIKCHTQNPGDHYGELILNAGSGGTILKAGAGFGSDLSASPDYSQLFVSPETYNPSDPNTTLDQRLNNNGKSFQYLDQTMAQQYWKNGLVVDGIDVVINKNNTGMSIPTFNNSQSTNTNTGSNNTQTNTPATVYTPPAPVYTPPANATEQQKLIAKEQQFNQNLQAQQQANYQTDKQIGDAVGEGLGALAGALMTVHSNRETRYDKLLSVPDGLINAKKGDQVEKISNALVAPTAPINNNSGKQETINWIIKKINQFFYNAKESQEYCEYDKSNKFADNKKNTSTNYSNQLLFYDTVKQEFVYTRHAWGNEMTYINVKAYRYLELRPKGEYKTSERMYPNDPLMTTQWIVTLIQKPIQVVFHTNVGYPDVALYFNYNAEADLGKNLDKAFSHLRDLIINSDYTAPLPEPNSDNSSVSVKDASYTNFTANYKSWTPTYQRMQNNYDPMSWPNWTFSQLMASAIKTNSPHWQTMTGEACQTGTLGANKNYWDAMKWYLQAAAQDDKISMVDLGILYEFGLGVDIDRQKAQKWYHMAVDDYELDLSKDMANKNVAPTRIYMSGFLQCVATAEEGLKRLAHPGSNSLALKGSEKGKKTYTDGSTYDGDLLNDVRSGNGINIWPSGDKYTGEWANDKINGKGLYNYADGRIFDGYWKDGFATGPCKYTMVTGDILIGNFERSMLNGKGAYVFADGRKYDGMWLNGFESGQGTFTWPNGDKYIGQWAKGNMNGTGVFAYADGTKFEGQYKNGLKDGPGIFTYGNGKQHAGEWANDKEIRDNNRDVKPVGKDSILQQFPKAKKTQSGLYYYELNDGTGSPIGNNVNATVHYVGTLLNGKKFDSSRDRNEPFTFPVGAAQVIKGWDEGVAMMKMGQKMKFIVPPSLAYGANAVGFIPANSYLVLEVELLSVSGQKEGSVPDTQNNNSASTPTQTATALNTPCYIIGYSAVADEKVAKNYVAQLVQKSFKAGYMWVPDYEPGGKAIYRVYIGPFKTMQQANTALPGVKQMQAGAYIKLIDRQ